MKLKANRWVYWGVTLASLASSKAALALDRCKCESAGGTFSDLSGAQDQCGNDTAPGIIFSIDSESPNLACSGYDGHIVEVENAQGVPAYAHVDYCDYFDANINGYVARARHFCD